MTLISSATPEEPRIDSRLRLTPRSLLGAYQTREARLTAAGSARRTPMEKSDAAVIFCAGRLILPATSRPIPHPTTVWVAMRRLDRTLRAAFCDGMGKYMNNMRREGG